MQDLQGRLPGIERAHRWLLPSFTVSFLPGRPKPSGGCPGAGSRALAHHRRQNLDEIVPFSFEALCELVPCANWRHGSPGSERLVIIDRVTAYLRLPRLRDGCPCGLPGHRRPRRRGATSIPRDQEEPLRRRWPAWRIGWKVSSSTTVSGRHGSFGQGTSDLDGDEALAAQGMADRDSRTEQGDAAEWLRAPLSRGPRLRKDLEKPAKADGIGFRSVQRALKGLGVTTTRTGFQTGSIRKLPLHSGQRIPIRTKHTAWHEWGRMA